MKSGAAVCRRCGSCCLEGGAALHREDLRLIERGALRPADLVTIRCGEMALQPGREEPQRVEAEFLKLGGKGRSWACRFYVESSRECSIYAQRPLACRLLQCDRPEALLDIVGKDLLTRFDLMAADDPLYQLAAEHEARCPCPDLQDIGRRIAAPCPEDTLFDELDALINTDLRMRDQAVQHYGLSLERELFTFGRPLFQILAQVGLKARQGPAGLALSRPVR